jgi:hypothetical protein
MGKSPIDGGTYKLRLYAAGVFGWGGAIALAAGFIAAALGAHWGQRCAGFGAALVAAANEVDPSIELPWTMRAGLALVTAFGALIGVGTL